MGLYGPWSCKESDKTEQLSLQQSLIAYFHSHFLFDLNFPFSIQSYNSY